MDLPSYKDYAAAAHAENQAKLQASIKAADTDYAKAKATYGTRASFLLGKGLSESGYSDYLQNAAYAARANKLSEAEKSYADAENKSQSAYAAFLQEARKEAENAYNKEQSNTASAFSKLLAQSVADKEIAKSYLVSMGVDSDTAETLAAQSIDIYKNSFSRRNAVLNTVIGERMEYERAYRYALANGLSERLAREIAALAESSLLS